MRQLPAQRSRRAYRITECPASTRRPARAEPLPLLASLGSPFGATAGLFNIGGINREQHWQLDGSSSIVITTQLQRSIPGRFLGLFGFSFQSGDIISNNNIGTITINNGGTGTGSGVPRNSPERHCSANWRCNQQQYDRRYGAGLSLTTCRNLHMYGIDLVSATLIARET